MNKKPTSCKKGKEWLSKVISMVNLKELAINPYIRLIRVSSPIPILLLFFPVFWTLIIAANNFAEFTKWFLVLFVGAFAMRSAGCIINDMIDRDIDIKVDRTKTRPLASGELSMHQAFIMLAVFLLIAFICFIIIPITAKYIAVIALIMTALYPLSKRYSNYPQAILGLTFNLGVFVAWFCIHSDLILIPILIYLASALWTFGYDTIYGLQDIEFDKKIGIGSAAISLESGFKKAILQFYLASVSLLGLACLAAYISIFVTPLFILAAYLLYWQVERLDMYNTTDVLAKFNSNIYYGAVIAIALVLGKF